MPINVHQGCGGEGIDTASDHAHSNTRLKTPETELKGNPRGSNSEDGKRKRRAHKTAMQRAKKAARNRRRCSHGTNEIGPPLGCSRSLGNGSARRGHERGTAAHPVTAHGHRGCRPTVCSKAEGTRAEYREDGDGAAASMAQAVSRGNIAAIEGPGGSGTAGSRQDVSASDGNMGAEAFTSAIAEASRGHAAQAQDFVTASGRPTTRDPAACARRSEGVDAVERKTPQAGAVDCERDRDPGDVGRGIPARDDEGGAEAHACDEDTDAATVRKLSNRGLHAPIHVQQGLQARRGITAGQGGGEGIGTALDHTRSNTRLRIQKNELKSNPRGSNSEDGKRKRRAHKTAMQRAKKAAKSAVDAPTEQTKQDHP